MQLPNPNRCNPNNRSRKGGRFSILYIWPAGWRSKVLPHGSIGQYWLPLLHQVERAWVFEVLFQTRDRDINSRSSLAPSNYRYGKSLCFPYRVVPDGKIVPGEGRTGPVWFMVTWAGSKKSDKPIRIDAFDNFIHYCCAVQCSTRSVFKLSLHFVGLCLTKGRDLPRTLTGSEWRPWRWRCYCWGVYLVNLNARMI